MMNWRKNPHLSLKLKCLTLSERPEAARLTAHQAQAWPWQPAWELLCLLQQPWNFWLQWKHRRQQLQEDHATHVLVLQAHYPKECILGL